MTYRTIVRHGTALLSIVICLSPAPSYSQNEKTVVVTTSMLEHAALEVIPASAHISVVRLIEPGSCPGHFDLNPRAVPVLRKAVVVLRHDFQGNLEEKIARMGVNDITTVPVAAPGNLVIPSSYAALTGQVADILSTVFTDYSAELRKAAVRTKNRTASFADTLLQQSLAWKNIPVIASVNQKDFCEWLGFRVVGVINRPEDMTPRDFENLITKHAKLVVGNLQEGTEAALSLGGRMKIPVAILSSFPDVEGYGTGFDSLVKENMKRIEEAWRLL